MKPQIGSFDEILRYDGVRFIATKQGDTSFELNDNHVDSKR
jgi:hypothetical protein